MAIILAAIIALTCSTAVFADNTTSPETQPESNNGNSGVCIFVEEQTVIWSEAKDGEITLITAPEYDELPQSGVAAAVRIVLKTDSLPELRSDGSSQSNRAMEDVKNGKRIAAGTVIRVEFNGAVDDSWPAGYGTIYSITFTKNRTPMTVYAAKAILDELNDISDIDKYYLPDEEVTNFDVVSNFVVVGAVKNDKTGRIDLAISSRQKHFSVAENQERWYYTTSNISVGGDSVISLSSDGTEVGHKQYTNCTSGMPVALGTVVSVRWSGLIAEVYPPDLCGIKEICFTGKTTDYTAEDIEQERKAMNEVFEGGDHYPAIANPGQEFIPSAENTNGSKDSNPKTGREEIFGDIALLGTVFWVLAVIALRNKNIGKA